MLNIRHQHGVVLVVSLIFLMLMTIIGTTAMQGTTQGEKMANNAAQRGLAFQHAEAGLRAAEALLLLPNVVANPFDNTTPGLRRPINTAIVNITNYWMDNYDWNGSSIRWCYNPNNFEFCSTLTEDIRDKQRYVIERLTAVTTSGSGEILAGRPPPPAQRFLYRITARGTGNVTDAVVILQSTIM